MEDKQDINISKLRDTLLAELEDQDPKEVLADVMMNLLQTEALNKNLYAIVTAIADLLIEKGLITAETFSKNVLANLKEVEKTLSELTKE